MIRRRLTGGAMSEIKAKTSHGEMTIDQLAEIQPGMAAVMKQVGERFTEAFFAAMGGNWKLAAHHLNQVRSAFRVGSATRPKFAEDLATFDKEYLQPIIKAIHDQDWGQFQEAFKRGEAASDVYHEKRGYPYIRYVLPSERPSNLYVGPPENFKRG